MIKNYKGCDLTVFMLNVGEHPIIFKTIPRLRALLPKHEIVIWNNGCAKSHADVIRPLADVFIDCTHNMWTSKGFGFGILYLEYKYLMITAPDIIIPENFWSLVLRQFEDPQVGYVGEIMKPVDIGSSYDADKDSMPDGFHVVKRECVNWAGSISPSFGLYGMDLTEWQFRILDAGWKVRAIKTGIEHYGDGHTGVSQVIQETGKDEYEKGLDRSCKAYKRQRKNWWNYDII